MIASKWAEFLLLEPWLKTFIVGIYVFLAFLVVVAVTTLYRLIVHRSRIGYWRGVVLALLVCFLITDIEKDGFGIDSTIHEQAFLFFMVGFGIYTVWMRKKETQIANRPSMTGDKRFCPECGASVLTKAVICMGCGCPTR